MTTELVEVEGLDDVVFVTDINYAAFAVVLAVSHFRGSSQHSNIMKQNMIHNDRKTHGVYRRCEG